MSNMSKEPNPYLVHRLQEYIDVCGSQNKAASNIGISSPIISQYRRGIYTGDVNVVEQQLEEFFKANDEQSTMRNHRYPYVEASAYIPTSVSEDVYKAIRYCQLERGMVVLHGDAGIGKTKAAEKFVLENPAAAIYIQATPSTGTLNILLKLIARALKVSEKNNKLDLMIGIRQKLEGTNKIIIIDEAQHLKLSALEEIRTLSDPNTITGQAGTGIVLIGNTEVYGRMLGKQEARFAQLFSRIRMNRCYSTSNITKDDVLKLFPCLGSSESAKQVEFLHGICQSKWGVRGAVNVYNNAVNSDDISYDGLYKMARSMGIGLL